MTSRPKPQDVGLFAVKLINLATSPLLIQHGDADQVIPYTFGQQLFAAANAPKTFETLPNQGHEALFQSKIWAREVAFFAQIPENQHHPIGPPCDTPPRALL